MSLTIVPVTLAEANEFVRLHHRHHREVVGHKFSIGCADDFGEIVGVAIIGRPVARLLDNGWTLEVTRVATDGTEHACSALYGGGVQSTAMVVLAAYRALRGVGPPRRACPVRERRRDDSEHPATLARDRVGMFLDVVG